MVEIRHCKSEADWALAMRLLEAYIEWLNIDLSFQNIDGELSNFSSMYSYPNGLFLLAWVGKKVAGGVGLRMLNPSICEMKRLFVYDKFRRKGVGRRLCAAIIDEAKKMNYKKMRLDTLGKMNEAINLYKNFGFIEIEPYRFNPDPTAKYMELDL